MNDFKEGEDVRYLGETTSSFWEEGDTLTLGKFNPQAGGEGMWEIARANGEELPYAQWSFPNHIEKINE